MDPGELHVMVAPTLAKWGASHQHAKKVRLTLLEGLAPLAYSAGADALG